MTDYFDDGYFLVIVFVCYIRITDHYTEHDIDSISILYQTEGDRGGEMLVFAKAIKLMMTTIMVLLFLFCIEHQLQCS